MITEPDDSRNHVFTFHYGSIQMRERYREDNLWIRIYIPLWFYSNSECLHSVERLQNLHSTMVLFKWINVLIVQRTDKCIYIPLWFYSNDNIKNGFSSIGDIYIPLWFYSNSDDHSTATSCPNLHSTMVLFKLYNKCACQAPLPWFTFHYGSIQIILYIVLLCVDKYLHSTMVLFKCKDIAYNCNLKPIYIPLWFYSNLPLTYPKRI